MLAGVSAEAEVALRLVESPDDPAIAAFGRLQTRVYYDSGALIPGKYIPQMLASRSSRRTNLLLVAEQAGQVVGGTFFHHLADAGSAFSSFMGIVPEARGRGLARRLHEARFAALDAVSGGNPVVGVFIDVVAPERLPRAELDSERRFGFDPQKRRPAFRALGFCTVAIPYRQPVGGPGGGPLETLDLLFCPRGAAVTEIPRALVLSTLRAYWQPWLGAERARRELLRLEHSVGTSVPLVDCVA
jgi:GNAT superfamily N-acetyltransferase